MKKVIALLTFVFAVAMVACQDQHSMDSDSSNQFLETIARNPAYKAYKEASREIQLNIALGSFDLHALTDVGVKYPQYQTACDMPKEIFTGIKGGFLYQELECKLTKVAENLKKETPEYFSLNSEQMHQVSKNYDRIEGIDWANTIKNALIQRNKN